MWIVNILKLLSKYVYTCNAVQLYIRHWGISVIIWGNLHLYSSSLNLQAAHTVYRRIIRLYFIYLYNRGLSWWKLVYFLFLFCLSYISMHSDHRVNHGFLIINRMFEHLQLFWCNFLNPLLVPFSPPYLRNSLKVFLQMWHKHPLWLQDQLIRL